MKRQRKRPSTSEAVDEIVTLARLHRLRPRGFHVKMAANAEDVVETRTGVVRIQIRSLTRWLFGMRLPRRESIDIEIVPHDGPVILEDADLGESEYTSNAPTPRVD
jgi:hypothetical protein